MGMYVAAEPCAECLFSANRVVRPRRAVEIIRACIREQRFFVCHKHSLRESRGECAHTDAQVCCRRFYDKYRDRVWPLRYAYGKDAIVLVNEAGEAVAGEGWGPHES